MTRKHRHNPPLPLYLLLVLLAWLACACVPVAAATGPTGTDTTTATTTVPAGTDAAEALPTLPPTLYYKAGEKGWFWYEQTPTKPAKKKPQEPKQVVAAAAVPAAPSPKPEEDPNDPLVRMKLFQEELERIQARAVLDPTPANVQAFMLINAQTQARAGKFAEVWQQVLLGTPQLDYRLVKPVDDAAIHAVNDAKLVINEEGMRAASKEYGLFFFFKSTCPYCIKIAPVIKQFSAQYGFHVVPVSLDGAGLPEYPEFKSGQQAGIALKVESTPAIFLVNPKKRDIQPISYGYITWDELRTRIYTVLNKRSANPLQAQEQQYNHYLQSQPTPKGMTP